MKQSDILIEEDTAHEETHQGKQVYTYAYSFIYAQIHYFTIYVSSHNQFYDAKVVFFFTYLLSRLPE